jgi:hypothetical protein
MSKSKLNAVTLRGILSTGVVLLIALASVGFYFAHNWLQEMAVSVSHSVAQSATTDNSVQALQKLQEELSTRQDIITKTNSIFTSTTTYQTQAVQDLIAYAAASGITISNYSFPAPGASSSATASSIPSTLVTITLTSPVSYTNLLKFMTLVEGNLPKMQITSINIGRIAGDSESVKIDQLTVAVYTR